MRASAPLSKGRTPGAPRAPRFGLDHALARRAVRLVGAAFLPLRRPPVVVGWPRDYNRSRREQVRPMERRISMPLGVVVERREIDNRWQPFAWKAVAVIPGAPPVEAWRELERGERFVRWHAATLPLELHRAETEAYCVNL